MLAALTCHAIAAQNTAPDLTRFSGAPSLASLRDPQYCVLALASYFAARDRGARPTPFECAVSKTKTIASVRRGISLAER